MTRPSSASGAVHSVRLRVYYEDTDAAGIVYYANYLKFAERGRTEMMRELGFAHSEIAKEIGTLFTVRRCSIDYRAPARLDDALTVDTRVVEIGGATLLLDQQIRRDDPLGTDHPALARALRYPAAPVVLRARRIGQDPDARRPPPRA